MFATEQARLEGLVHIGRKQGTEPPDGGGDLSPPEEKGSGKAHQPSKADKEDSMLMWRIHEVRELGLVWHPDIQNLVLLQHHTELDKNWTLMTNWNLEAQLGSVAEVVVGTGVVDHQSLLGVGSDPQQRNTLSKS